MEWVRTLELIGLAYSFRFRLFWLVKAVLHCAVQDLRHSFANFLVSIGINQRDLRTILGHYKPETLALVQNNSFENNVRA